MPTFNKLVRDLIPDIIAAEGKTVTSRILDDAEYRQALREKLVEEANEVLTAEGNEELIKEVADVFEVLEALIAAHGLNIWEIRVVQSHCQLRRGGFEKRIFLESSD